MSDCRDGRPLLPGGKGQRAFVYRERITGRTAAVEGGNTYVGWSLVRRAALTYGVHTHTHTPTSSTYTTYNTQHTILSTRGCLTAQLDEKRGAYSIELRTQPVDRSGGRGIQAPGTHCLPVSPLVLDSSCLSLLK